MEPNRKGRARQPGQYLTRSSEGGTKGDGWVWRKGPHREAKMFYTQQGLPAPVAPWELTAPGRGGVPNNPNVAMSMKLGHQMMGGPATYHNPYNDAEIPRERLMGVGFNYSEQRPAPATLKMGSPQPDVHNQAIASAYEVASFDGMYLPGPLTKSPEQGLAQGWRQGPGTAMRHPSSGNWIGTPIRTERVSTEALLALGTPPSRQPMMAPVSPLETPASSEIAAAGNGNPGSSNA